MIIGDDGIVNQALDAKETTEEEAKKSEESRNSLMNEMLETNQLREPRPGIKVGDYIDYTPDTNTSSYLMKKEFSGFSLDKTIEKDTTLKWRVLNINSDGSIDLISSKQTNQRVYLKGAIGYNNGVYLLHDICEKLYSNSNIGVKARSINIEDIEKTLTPEKKEELYSEDRGYGVKYKYQRVDIIMAYPNLYEKENGSGKNTTITKTDGINRSDKGVLQTNSGYILLNEGEFITVTNTYPSIALMVQESSAIDVIGRNFYTSDYYWIASRFASCYQDGVAEFGIMSWLDDLELFNTYSNIYVNAYKLRPIVSLTADIQIEVSETASRESGTPHTIIY